MEGNSRSVVPRKKALRRKSHRMNRSINNQHPLHLGKKKAAQDHNGEAEKSTQGTNRRELGRTAAILGVLRTLKLYPIFGGTPDEKSSGFVRSSGQMPFPKNSQRERKPQKKAQAARQINKKDLVVANPIS